MPALIQEQVLLNQNAKCPLLDERFSAIKQQLVEPANKQAVVESYGRLCKVLEQETALIAKHQQKMVPEIDFSVVLENGGELPQGLADLVRERGCVIFRNVVPEAQAVAWEAELKQYTKSHPNVGGFPSHDPQNWSLWWTRPQVQMRSHEKVLGAMKAISKLWHVNDPNLPMDLSTQVTYPDRFRIRHPSKDGEYTLNAHLDSGAIERWEDPEYRKCYKSILEGKWETYDGWLADSRLDAKMDLYATGSSCSCWRSMQGWLSLSHTSTGEGTLRLLPNLKASTAYIMLRPFFLDGADAFDDKTPTFPGATPGGTQFYPTRQHHPHLDLDRAMIGIPPVKPGDYVFWHADLVHEVDKFHPGTTDSSVSYMACTPLTPYNISSLKSTRESFLQASPPADFGAFLKEEENQHDDHGARKENILSREGMQAMGFEAFDVDGLDLSEGQRAARVLANERLGLVSK